MKLRDGMSITWFGHAGFKIVTPGGKTLLIDPWLTGNPVCPENIKIDHADLILVTHLHFDHLGDTIPLAQRTKAKIIAPPETCWYLQTKGIDAANTLLQNKGGSQVVNGVRVTMVHADHSCGFFEDGKIIYGGDPVGYVLEFENGFKIYHAGDTNVFGDMRIIGDLYEPELVMYPVGDLFTMSPREAAYGLRLLGAKKVIPMHYATFPVLVGTPQALREYTKDIAGLEIVELQPGQTIS